ncbi:response regulator transcription factor [Sulfitobacter sp. TSTF-M16]|uniref:Response regulator transcription factor n=2 Tax=Sulfitobacter aestuariivivens TaxID=2766981 RepID=A0A927D2A3_9RHOB|nr:response regulator [Sulfitobacter aestuariivivens]MBD3663694.1 response regulator transcription factor [Sulfitobacter aestuariivivens]
MSTRKCVAIVDDDRSVLASTSVLLSALGYATSQHPSGEHFLEEADLDRIDCLVLDVRMPGISGLELQKELSDRDISIPIVFITAHGDIPMAVKAIRAGAADMIEKPFTQGELTESIEFSLRYRPFSGPNSMTRDAANERLDRLTKREREVFELVVLGETNKTIGRELEISPRTVDVHRKKLREKLGADRLADLIRLKQASG